MPKAAATPKAATKRTAATLKPGWFAAVTLKPDTAPLRCYVGQIQAVDAFGMRITLIDWILHEAVSWDLFVPHNNIESVLIATEDHDQKVFGEAAGKWQTKMNGDENQK